MGTLLLSAIAEFLISAKGQQVTDELIAELMKHLFTKAPTAATAALVSTPTS